MDTDIERGVLGYNKNPNSNGEDVLVIEYKLKNIDLQELRRIFQVDMQSPDPAVLDMIYPIQINEHQAKSLNKYIINGEIDITKYNFFLDCWQSEV